MVTTRGRTLAAEARAAQEAREGDVDQGQKKTTGETAHRANRAKNNNVPPSTPSSGDGKGKEKRMSRQLSTRLGRGKLQGIMNMPIEIFAEICYYLDLLDLRHLALTNKRMWDVLMTKEAKHIWKKALSSVTNPPECPTDLNEPQYVCLMYSSECHTLGCQSRGTQVDWFYRVRFCKGCFNVKMANGPGVSDALQSVRYRSWFTGLLQYLDGSKIYDFARNVYSDRGKHFYIDEVNNMVETYKALLKEPDAEQRIGEYKKQLSDQSRYRASTGAPMLKWHLLEMDIRAKEVTARKQARFESVKAKLMEAGWDPIDFPTPESREFRDLIYKEQQLTPKIWQSVEPKLVSILQKNLDERLERERQNRRLKRGQAVLDLYHDTARDTTALNYSSWALAWYIPDQSSINTLPKVQEMLEADTETITKDQWLEVESDVRTLVRRHWKIVLRTVLALVEPDTALPTTGGNIKSNEGEDDERLVEDIQAMSGKLARVTATFVCKSKTCNIIHWFPDVLIHASCKNPATDISTLLRYCDPLDAERRQLVKRMVVDLGLDADDAKEADVIGLTNLICTRCDPNIASYSNFSQAANHYIQAQRWFFFVKQAKQIRSHPHTVIDDHDWLSNDAPLVRQDDEAERASIELLQKTFRTQALTDPTCDVRGIGGEDLRIHYFDREIKRCCRLCPQDLGPLPCSTSVMKIHIRAKHGKEPDLDRDTSRNEYFATCPCPT